MRSFLIRNFGGLRGLFFLLAMAMGLTLHFYTQQIVRQLRQESRSQVQLYAKILSRVAEAEDSEDMNLSFIFEEIIQRINFPIINTDKDHYPSSWKGIGIDPEDRSEAALAKVSQLVERMDREIEPVKIHYQDQVLGYLYYGDSLLIQQLQWLPTVEILVVGLFVLMGFLGYANTKKSEQRHIWVGMAKETAHQLGTPISSLMGWIEVMQTSKSSHTTSSDTTSSNTTEILLEMQRDVQRLQQVSNRFSQIGSRPRLETTDLKAVIGDAAAYIRRRAPQIGKPVTMQEFYGESVMRPLNYDIFQWALENIMKNALDAMDKPEGVIQIRCGMANQDTVYIEIQDNGRGMEERDRKRVFKPGYSTKKRGWGLGLTLAKRIVEEYHKGRLFVKESRPGTGTTMRIEL
ncbi:HAMP domain-containing histidine kinase [bacterium]|nr:HAMP domain-containing histidine kinase [bacterium]